MSYTLHGSPAERSVKILIAAQFAGIQLKVQEYNPYIATPEQKAEYLKKNPNGLIPTLETPEGYLCESNAILRYIARHNENSTLYGTTDYEKAIVDQFLDWTSMTLEFAVYPYLLVFFGRIKYDKTAHEQAFENLKKALRILDDRLKQNKYLAGDHITIADFQVISSLHLLFRYVFDEKARKPFQNLAKYLEGLLNEENVKKVLGRPVFCKTPLKVPSN